MEKIYQQQPIVFAKGLLPLIGLGHEQLVQATCFYSSVKNHYVLDEILVEKANDIMLEVKNCEFGSYRDGLANFEIKLPKRLLQVRIKPMNKFTAPSFKVNCSVKKLS